MSAIRNFSLLVGSVFSISVFAAPPPPAQSPGVPFSVVFSQVDYVSAADGDEQATSAGALAVQGNATSLRIGTTDYSVPAGYKVRVSLASGVLNAANSCSDVLVSHKKAQDTVKKLQPTATFTQGNLKINHLWGTVSVGYALQPGNIWNLTVFPGIGTSVPHKVLCESLGI